MTVENDFIHFLFFVVFVWLSVLMYVFVFYVSVFFFCVVFLCVFGDL